MGAVVATPQKKYSTFERGQDMEQRANKEKRERCPLCTGGHIKDGRCDQCGAIQRIKRVNGQWYIMWILKV